jgi:hypothetical protein
MVLDHLLPLIQLQPFLEWTLTSFELSVVESYSILLEEHLRLALEMLQMTICSSLQSPKLVKVVQGCSDMVTVLAR